MKYAFLSLLTLATALTSCDKDNDSKPAIHGLEGTWQLIGRQCYCPAAPLPNETLTLTATTYAVARS